MNARSLFSNLSLVLESLTKTNKRRKLIFVLLSLIILSQILHIRWSRAKSEFDEDRNFPSNSSYQQRSHRFGAGEDANLEIQKKRSKIVEMVRHAWNGYVKYAWGSNELKPVSKKQHLTGIFGSQSFGATLVDAMDTLYILGLYNEFEQGRNWIASHLNFDNIDIELPVFEINIRFIGGLLSCYALTGDSLFKNKAEYIAQKLLPAFDSATGIPYAFVHAITNETLNNNWGGDNFSILSEIGSLHLEFSYLSDITGNNVYRDKVRKLRKFLNRKEKIEGLYSNFIHPETGKWGEAYLTSVGGGADSYYEYLLKSWIQNGKTEVEDRKMFDEAMEAILTHLVRKSSNGLIYVGSLRNFVFESRMDAFSCFFGAVLSLGSMDADDILRSKYLHVAEKITETCHEAYRSSYTKLAPEEINFSNYDDSANISVIKIKAEQAIDYAYRQRPETMESYFTLWRVTKNPKYRKWGWEIIEALEQYCRTEAGYSGIIDVYDVFPQQDDVQQTFFIAELMKYSYLLFSDDSFFSFEQWVFNTEAHPLPVKRTSSWN